MKVIIDFDGTLTPEEDQAGPLSEKALDTLASEILRVSRQELQTRYTETRAAMLQAPHRYWWEVNGLIASYCDEGAFILHTTTLLVMLRNNEAYARKVAAAYPQAEYGPANDCANDLFHRHTAEFPPTFRPGGRDVLVSMLSRADLTPIILTNSLGDKVSRFVDSLGLNGEVPILGDTRQYEMDPHWEMRFPHPTLGEVAVWPIHHLHQVDLRRPQYFRALKGAAADGEPLVVVADTFSMPGALPLMMGIPFLLLRTTYTPEWCLQAVSAHPLGHVLEDLSELVTTLDDPKYQERSTIGYGS